MKDDIFHCPQLFPLCLLRFHRTVATLVHGKVNPKGLNYDSEQDMTAATFFVDKLDLRNSFSLLVVTTEKTQK